MKKSKFPLRLQYLACKTLVGAYGDALRGKIVHFRIGKQTWVYAEVWEVKAHGGMVVAPLDKSKREWAYIGAFDDIRLVFTEPPATIARLGIALTWARSLYAAENP